MMKKSLEDRDYVHYWFGLTYASYLVIQRSILQSMPSKWQKKLVKLLEELDKKVEELPNYEADFWVRAKKDGKFVQDIYANYDRGRRQVFK